MPKTYVRIADGKVADTYINDTDQPMSSLFHPELIWVDVTDLNPVPEEGATYDGASFGAPVPFTDAELRIRFDESRALLMEEAKLKISLLQDAFDLDDQSDGTVAALKAWRQYRLDLSRLTYQLGVALPQSPDA